MVALPPKEDTTTSLDLKLDGPQNEPEGSGEQENLLPFLTEKRRIAFSNRKASVFVSFVHVT